MAVGIGVGVGVSVGVGVGVSKFETLSRRLSAVATVDARERRGQVVHAVRHAHIAGIAVLVAASQIDVEERG